jgi:hypothetical protein
LFMRNLSAIIVGHTDQLALVGETLIGSISRYLYSEQRLFPFAAQPAR